MVSSSVSTLAGEKFREVLTDSEPIGPLLCTSDWLPFFFLPKFCLCGQGQLQLPVALIEVGSGKAFTATPLQVGQEEDADIAGFGNEGFEAVAVFFHAIHISAGAGIDAELDHEVAVIEQFIPEAGRCFTLLFGQYWKIEHDEEPAHFKRGSFVEGEHVRLQRGWAARALPH